MTFLKFHKLTSFALAIGATALLGACGNNNKNGATDATPVPSSTPTSSKGTIAADWTYTGSEAPSRVKILLVDAASNGLTCTTMPFAPAAGVLQTLPNLPANGAANFTQVAPGTKYIVLAIGETASGARVAAACRDQVNVIAGQTTDVSLLDEIVVVTDDQARETAQLIARHQGLLVGISSGAAAFGCLQVTHQLPAGATVVTIFPDTGERYLSLGGSEEDAA